MLAAIVAATFVATCAGGLVALRFRDRLHLILGLSGGAILGVAFFELLPEALEQGSVRFGAPGILALSALGFILYLFVDRTIAGRRGPDDHGDGHGHGHHHHDRSARRGLIGAASLSTHSFLDGIAIGVAFKVSAALGGVIAFAVILHDASDGMNTVNMILKNGGDRGLALRWLLVDAAAPVLGALFGYWIGLPEGSLAAVLALFAGFFLYLGASDLVPESFHAHPKMATSLMTVLGMSLIFALTQIAHAP